MKINRFSLLHVLSTACLSLTLASAAKAELTNDCKHATQPLPYDYCITRSAGSQNPDVLYHFHALKQGHKAWTLDSLGTTVEKTWAQDGFESPTVVTISFGQWWLLAEKNSKPQSGLYENFLQIMSDIEKNDLGSVVGRRQIVGASMGGFNGLQLYLKRSELFERAAILCPTVAKVNPWSTEQEIGDYIRRTQAKSMWVNFAIKMTEVFFDSESSYAKSDPLMLASKSHKSFPKLHLSCGANDQFGLFEGTQFLKDELAGTGTDITWEPLSGGHCAKDPVAVARFLETL